MHRRHLAFAIAFTITSLSAARAAPDLSALDKDTQFPKAQVLVLGTVHLKGLSGKPLDPDSLAPLLQKLAAFRPDVITVEQQSGEECDAARRFKSRYDGGYNCASTDAAQAATGLDIPAASEAIDTTLKTWPRQPSAAQRRRLAALFLAAAEEPSALAQWLQLPAAERREGDGLDAALAQRLGQLMQSQSESLLIGARLAARLGLPRVHAIDNHTGDNLQVPDEKRFWAAVQASWAAGYPDRKAREATTAALARADDLLPLYRFLNDPANMGIDGWGGVQPSMQHRTPERFPEMWVAGWDIRNLRMVANIRETFRERPGARVLTIVGAAHKPWFDHWLAQLQGVSVVNAVDALK
ncbi:DUF5694 domain-containing protein [Roseateles sp.]|uniref:DUF5694 domain-containing protein n=1 Tax=Roseateles sp. TaxID=1971397 RepID=UPI003BA8CEA8